MITSECLLKDNGKPTPTVGALMTELAEIAYDKSDWGGGSGSIKRFNELGFPIIERFENRETDTQAYVVSNDHAIVIANRGSESDIDWASNFNFKKRKISFFDRKKRKEARRQLEQENKTTNVGKGRAHQGHYKCMLSIAPPIIKYIHNIPEWQSKDIYLGGQSLGGSITTHFFGYADPILNFEMAYAIAASLPGDKNYVRFLNKQANGRLWVVENNTDIVCKVPLRLQGYRRLKNYIYISSTGRIHTHFNPIWRLFDIGLGLIKAPFTDDKGPADDHHPCTYYNVFAKAAGDNRRLDYWQEYKDKGYEVD